MPESLVLWRIWRPRFRGRLFIFNILFQCTQVHYVYQNWHQFCATFYLTDFQKPCA